MWIRHDKPLLGKILLLLVALLLGGLAASGCMGARAVPRGWSGATVADGTLFVGSMEGKLVALDISDGTQRWTPVVLETSTSAGGFGCAPGSTTVAIYGTPAVGRDLAYVAGYNGKIYAINSNAGTLRWVYPRQGNLQRIVGGPVVAQGMVYFGCSDGKVYALDADTGDWKWEFQTGGKIWSTPVIESDTLYIGSFDKRLYALNATDGSKKWEPFETEGSIAAPPLVYNNTIYFGSFDRRMYAISAYNGREIWRFAGENWFWAKAVAYNNTVYAGCLDGKVYALDAENGHKVAEFDLGSPVSSPPVLVDSSIIVATEEGEVFSIDAGSNQKRQLADVEELADEDLTIRSPLFASEGIIYIHTEKDTLYAMDAQSGAIREFNIK